MTQMLPAPMEMLRTLNASLRLPEGFRKSVEKADKRHHVHGILRQYGLHSVCEEARCPNIGECFSNRTATFMILGDRCTRRCHFCSVKTAKPLPPRPEEPAELSKAVGALGLKHVVITSVDRDDLPDLGVSQFVRCIEVLRKDFNDLTIELLTPDFKGRLDLIDRVLHANPDVWGHNTETIQRLYSKLRPQSRYETSMSVLQYLAKSGAVQVKSGLMVGLGEEDEEVSETLRFLRSIGVHVVTIGQYLAPSRKHWPVARYVEASSYERWMALGKSLGFHAISAGPFVRSSYHAKDVHDGSKRLSA